MDIYHQILKQYWGYESFRPLQHDIITSVGSGKDTLGLMPTGGGKSLTFQVPALAKDGLCLVVTPLIALMKDQVQNLRSKGIKALAIHSGLTRDEINVVIDNCIFGEVKFLYLSPERLATELFLNKLPLLKVNLLAIDEAHCISQWGYDFRPSYLKVAEVRQALPDVPVLALTATATPAVVDDIQERLVFEKKNVFQKSFNRNNLAYVVRYAEDKEGQLIHILEKIKGSAVVYVRNRKRTKEISDLLNQNGISSAFFHAGMSNQAKDQKQKAWIENQTRVMVATNAFGMGIDKPDVRVVVHMNAPDSLEAYFQEAGRAGRDERKAFAVWLWSKNDVTQLKRSVPLTFPELDVVRRVYEALGNFFQVAVGSGFERVFDFDLAQFCKAFKLNVMVAFNSLKLLQRAGYIEYTEELELPSRLIFVMSKGELNRFLDHNEDLVDFVQLVLRSYTGVFSDYVVVSEDVIAKRYNSTRQQVYELFQKLARGRVIKYIPQKRTPLITYSTSREEKEYLKFSKAVYDERKKNYEARVEAVINYLEQDQICRSKQLLAYFGQKESGNCGVCDVCLAKKKTEVSVDVFDEIKAEIERILKQEPCVQYDLINQLKFNSQDVEKVIRWLEEYELMGENADGLLVWFRESV